MTTEPRQISADGSSPQTGSCSSNYGERSRISGPRPARQGFGMLSLPSRVQSLVEEIPGALGLEPT
jgi:hypothetical protein